MVRRHRYTAHWKLLCWAASVLSCSALVSWALVAIPALAVIGWRRIFHRVASIVGVLGVYLMRRYVDRRSFASLGLEPRGRAISDGWLGVRLAALTFLGLLAVLWWCGVWTLSLNPDHEKFWWSVMSFLPAALLVGCLEEVVFRGYILQTFLQDYGKATASVVTSLIYALAHLAKPLHLWPTMWADLIGLLLFGLVLAYAALQTRLLYLPIGVHASLVYLSKVQKHLIVFEGGSPHWLFGNERLVTGVMGWAAIGCLGWWIHRRTQGSVRDGR